MDTDLKPILQLNEYQKLRELIKQHSNGALAKDAVQLSKELDRAIVIQDKDNQEFDPTKTIRIGSYIEIELIKMNRKMKYQLVNPNDADLKSNKISILAPLGTALIGFKEGDQVIWQMPGGATELKILSVDNSHLV